MEVQYQKSEYTGCNNCKHTNVDARDYPCNECKNAIITFDHYKPMTNADRIRNMSDEELAELIHTNNFICAEMQENTKCQIECKKCLLQWLQAEVKEGGEDER